MLPLIMHQETVFRWGGMRGLFNRTAKEWREEFDQYSNQDNDNPYKKCNCCGKVYDDNAAIYTVGVYVDDDDHCMFKNICQACAYTAPKIIEANGNTYINRKCKNVIEIDADGVLFDIYTPAEAYLCQMGIDFSFERDVRSYTMTELGDQRNIVLQSLTIPECRKGAILYHGAQKFLQDLTELIEGRPVEVVINTAEYDIESVSIKARLLENLIGSLPIQKKIVLGDKTPLANAVICIEDALPNLEYSKAPIKICRAQFHNHDCGEDIFRTSSYDEMLLQIKKHLFFKG